MQCVTRQMHRASHSFTVNKHDSARAFNIAQGDIQRLIADIYYEAAIFLRTHNHVRRLIPAG